MMTRESQNQRRSPGPSPSRRSLRRFRSAFSTISTRLFLLIAGITSAAFASYAYFSVQTTAEHWRDMVTEGAQRSSSVINNSTHYSMLRNRKEEVHQIIRTIAEAPGVAGVSIYDKSGVIIFSADTAEIGQQVDLQAEACVICHDQAQPLRSVPASGRVREYHDAQGASLLGLINPIVNKPECSNADCHAHPPEQTILGVLD
ncbi:MAG: hypothetical protein GY856_24895, partial [bacterium]|nr:hypothetical protein [bacterium]